MLKLQHTLIFMLIIGGCSIFQQDPVCTLSSLPALHVEAFDAMTDERIYAFLAIAEEDDFVDSIWVIEGDLPIAQLAEERPGTYDLVIKSDGYFDWRQNHIRVIEDEEGCHVETIDVKARLDPR